MKLKYLFGFIIISLALVASAVIASDIQYPVAELGNCKNQADCKAYCNKPTNTSSCLSFAEKNGLMSTEELQQAKKFLAAGQAGPGGCTGKDECEAYCNDIAHIDQCISFAEKNGLMSPSELEEAKKVKSAIDRGVKPPACKNKKECDSYCEESDHMQECINFGIEAGFIQGKELEDSQKMMTALKKGIKPPPCKGKDACDAYCSSPDNIEVCMKFALEAGIMTEEEAVNSQRMLGAIKRGVKPPPCKGKDACDEYCSSDEHMQECIDFSVAAGMMSGKDAEMAKKTGGKGPGDCKGKDACEAFCNNPDNQETCFNFGRDNGMIPEDQLKQMEESKFNENREFQPGPGTENPGGQIMPPQAGPGGCKSPEECQKYCTTNPDVCKNFQPSQNQNQEQREQQNSREFQRPHEGQMPRGEQCQGEECQRGPLPGQELRERQELREGQEFRPPQNQQPGAGGNIPQGDYIPQIQVQPQEPPAGQQPPTGVTPPPPPPPPASIINTNSFAGSLLEAAFKFLFKK